MSNAFWENARVTLEFIFSPILDLFRDSFGWVGNLNLGEGWLLTLAVKLGVNLLYLFLLLRVMDRLDLRTYRKGEKAKERAKKTAKMLLVMLIAYSYPVVQYFLLAQRADSMQQLIFTLITATYAAVLLLIRMLEDRMGGSRMWIPMCVCFVFLLIRNLLMVGFTLQLVWALLAALVILLLPWWIIRENIRTVKMEENFERWLKEYPAQVEEWFNSEEYKEQQRKREEKERKRQEKEERWLREYDARVNESIRYDNLTPDQRAWEDEHKTGVSSDSRRFKPHWTESFSSESCAHCAYYDKKEQRCAYTYNFISNPENTSCRGFK